MAHANNIIEFDHLHAVDLPCGEMYVASYRVKAAYYPVFEWDDNTLEMKFVDMRFELNEVWRTDQATPYLVPAFGSHPDMVTFCNTLKDKARKIYDKRTGPADFAEVIVHDLVEDVAVKVIETINLKAA